MTSTGFRLLKPLRYLGNRSHGRVLCQDAKPEKAIQRSYIEVGEKGVSVDFSKVTPEMLDAYVKWEPPSLFDADNPTRALGLIRAAFFAGYKEGEVRRNKI